MGTLYSQGKIQLVIPGVQGTFPFCAEGNQGGIVPGSELSPAQGSDSHLELTLLLLQDPWEFSWPKGR